MPLSIGIDSELGAADVIYPIADSPVSLLRDYGESVTSSDSASHMPRCRTTGFHSRRYSVAPTLSTINEPMSPPPAPLLNYQPASIPQISARPPLLLAIIHVLLALVVYNNAVSPTPFVDSASTAAIDQHGQLVLAYHLYSPLCTSLTHPPLTSYLNTALHLLCLCTALGFHMAGWLMLAGSVVAVCDCVRCGRCGSSAVQYAQRLCWCALFGWTALYAWKCRNIKKVEGKSV